MADVNSPATSEIAPPSDEVIAQLRAAAVEEAGVGSAVGEYLGAVAEDAVARTLRFAADLPGYAGWHWSVTGAQVDDDQWTVSEVVLLPGTQALVAPEWVPWDQRVRPGDLGAGELLPIAPDDERLVPGYLQSDDPAIEDVAREFGLGRERVLSMDGRADAADRWHDGDFGPNNEIAQQAPGHCGTCGFFTPLAGLLGGAFGACANDMSPADGRVVDVEYGCGSHSEAAAAVVQHHAPPDTVIDELRMEIHRRPGGSAAGVASGQLATDPRAIALEAIRQLVPGLAGLTELPAAPVLQALQAAPTTPIALGGPSEPAAPIALGTGTATDSALGAGEAEAVDEAGAIPADEAGNVTVDEAGDVTVDGAGDVTVDGAGDVTADEAGNLTADAAGQGDDPA